LSKLKSFCLPAGCTLNELPEKKRGRKRKN